MTNKNEGRTTDQKSDEERKDPLTKIDKGTTPDQTSDKNDEYWDPITDTYKSKPKNEEEDEFLDPMTDINENEETQID